ncbi:MAG: hypothetical protein ABL958_16195 [Bdellovibrionia bacterium]
MKSEITVLADTELSNLNGGVNLVDYAIAIASSLTGGIGGWTWNFWYMSEATLVSSECTAEYHCTR